MTKRDLLLALEPYELDTPLLTLAPDYDMGVYMDLDDVQEVYATKYDNGEWNVHKKQSDEGAVKVLILWTG
jgi:hypothetical protein